MKNFDESINGVEKFELKNIEEQKLSQIINFNKKKDKNTLTNKVMTNMKFSGKTILTKTFYRI